MTTVPPWVRGCDITLVARTPERCPRGDVESLLVHIGEANASALEILSGDGAAAQLSRALERAAQGRFVRQHRSDLEGDAIDLLRTGDADACVCGARREVVLQNGK